MKKIVISGTQGFLGSRLKKHLDTKFELSPCDYELEDLSAIEQFLKSSDSLDFFFHFAGLSSVKQCEENPKRAYQINSEAPVKILKLLNKYFPDSHFIFPSTAHVYAPATDNEITLSEDSLVDPLNLYAKTKLEAELGLAEASQNINHKVTVFRLFNHSHKSQSPNFFLPSIYNQILNQKKPIVTGNLELVRDIGALQDLLTAFEALLEKPRPYRYSTFNISSGSGKKLHLLAEKLCEKLQYDVKNFIVDPNLMRSTEPHQIVGDCSKFMREFDWLPTHAQDETSLIESFLEDY